MNKRFFLYLMFMLVLSQTAPGQGWRKAYLPEVDLTAHIIQFADSLNGCVFTLRKYFRTTDGGNTWFRCSYPNDNYLINGKMASQSDFVLLLYDPKGKSGVQPTVHISTNAGNSWKESFSFRDANSVISSYIFQGVKLWFIGEDYDKAQLFSWNVDLKNGVYDSTSIPGGYPFPVGNWWYKGIGFRDSSNGYITAGQGLAPGLLPWGLVLKTTDGGKTWNDDTLMYAASFERVEFSDPMHGYVSGRIQYDYDPWRQTWTSMPGLRYTTDGGKSWTVRILTGVVKGYFIDDSLFCWINQNGDPPKMNGYFLKTNLLHWNPPYPFIIKDPDLFDFCKIGGERTWVLRDDGQTIYIWDPLLTSARNEERSVTGCALFQNYPNPAFGHTSIGFVLRNSAAVSLQLYDLLGRVVRHLAGGNYGAGNHEVRVNVDDLPAGIYLYALEISEHNQPRQRLARIMTHARMR